MSCLVNFTYLNYKAFPFLHINQQYSHKLAYTSPSAHKGSPSHPFFVNFRNQKDSAMASKAIEMSLVLVLVVMLCGGAMAQSSCTSALLGLSSCLNYITGNSSTPSSSCCSQLGNVVQSQPQCLCTVLSGGAAALGLNVNQTQALTLPRVCNVQTPPLSQCNSKLKFTFKFHILLFFIY